MKTFLDHFMSTGMRPLARIFMAAGCLALWSGGAPRINVLSAQETPPPAAPPPATASPSADEIAAAILDLGHDDFARREAATKALVKAGVAGVKPLALAAEHEDPEVAIRALRVLDVLFRTDDDVANEAAERELERLAQSKTTVIAEMSRGTLEALATVREQRAIRALVRLGAEVELAPDPLGRNRGFIMGRRDPVQAYQALIGEEWTGKEAGLTHLRKIASLKTVYVTPGAGFPPEVFERFEREFPPGMVQRRGAAMLGISANTDLMEGCIINSVAEGGPADRAGLEIQDLVLLYDGEGVTSFEQVIQQTFGFPPGRVVVVTVLRSGEILNLPVKLEKFTIKPRRTSPEPEGRGR